MFYPCCEQEWADVAEGFQARNGIGNIVGAVDGTLVRRSRPANFWSWYSRKGFPAYNVQGVVDASMRFMSFDIHPGSCTDQTLCNKCNMGEQTPTKIPRTAHFIGDSGCKLRTHFLVPFEHSARQDPRIATFNKKFCGTRIIVEMAFGALEGRWQILRRDLDMHSEEEDGKVIVACIVLHNFCLQYDVDIIVSLAETVSADENKSMGDDMVNHDADVFRGNMPEIGEDEEPALPLGVIKRRNIMEALLD